MVHVNTCPWCSSSFDRIRKNQRFCSPYCRNTFHSSCRAYISAQIEHGFLTVGIIKSWMSQYAWVSMHGSLGPDQDDPDETGLSTHNPRPDGLNVTEE